MCATSPVFRRQRSCGTNYRPKDNKRKKVGLTISSMGVVKSSSLYKHVRCPRTNRKDHIVLHYTVSLQIVVMGFDPWRSGVWG